MLKLFQHLLSILQHLPLRSRSGGQYSSAFSNTLLFRPRERSFKFFPPCLKNYVNKFHEAERIRESCLSSDLFGANYFPLAGCSIILANSFIYYSCAKKSKGILNYGHMNIESAGCPATLFSTYTSFSYFPCVILTITKSLRTYSPTPLPSLILP